jgi:hypothetical protein
VLLQRCIERARSIPPAAVLFEEPLRVRTLLAQGSHLIHQPTLRRLLTWARPEMRPDLAIVLVDRDGDLDRKKRLDEWLRDFSGVVVGTPAEEFKSWLIADVRAARDACALQSFDAPEPIESLPRGEAKRRLDASLAHDGANLSAVRGRRVTIARLCDLDIVASRCPSFAKLLQELSRS